MEINAVKTSYARWAPIYDRTFGAVTNAGRRSAVDYINQSDASDILEIGVGTGLALPHYRSDLRVTGIDFSAEMLDKARVRVTEMGLPHVHALRQMDARNLAFPDNSFDAVAAMHIVSVVPDPEQVMAEAARVLRPGGKIVITNHFASDSGGMALIEKLAAPFANLLGWHSDFEIGTVLEQPEVDLVERRSLPPLGMMTFLILEKTAG